MYRTFKEKVIKAFFGQKRLIIIEKLGKSLFDCSSSHCFVICGIKICVPDTEDNVAKF
jgi:hypothetical protein